jgi:transcriptional regulator with XRE-family HTH domain
MASAEECQVPWFPIKGVIKKLRLERRWSREELAKKSGVKIRTIRAWESDVIPRDLPPEFSPAFASV